MTRQLVKGYHGIRFQNGFPGSVPTKFWLVVNNFTITGFYGELRLLIWSQLNASTLSILFIKIQWNPCTTDDEAIYHKSQLCIE